MVAGGSRPWRAGTESCSAGPTRPTSITGGLGASRPADGRLARRPRRSSIGVDRPHAIAAGGTGNSTPSTELRRRIDAIRAPQMRGVTVEAVAPTSVRRERAGPVGRGVTGGTDPRDHPRHGGHYQRSIGDESMTGDAVRQVMWPVGGSKVLRDAFPPGSVDFFA